MIFLAPSPITRCRRPYTGASRSRRRMAKRAASRCRRDCEAVCTQECGSLDKRARGRGAWRCSCYDVRAQGWREAQPPTACTAVAQKRSPWGRTLPLRPGAYSISQLAFKDGAKTFGGRGQPNSDILKPSKPAVWCPWWFLRAQGTSTCTSFTVLFVTANKWKPLSCPSTGDWLNKTNIFMRQDLKNTVMGKKKASRRMMGTKTFF